MQGTCFHSGSPVLHLASTESDLMSRVFFRWASFFSMRTGFSQPPILASIQSVVDRSCRHSALEIHLFRRIWHGIHLFRSSWQHPILQPWNSVPNISMYHGWHLAWPLQGVPQIASFSTMCNFLVNFSHYSIALNLIFTAYTFSPTFPNFLSSLAQMEPTPSQVRNHYSQHHQEAHLERALAVKRAANLRCPSNVSLPNIFHHALYIMSRMTNVPDVLIQAGWRYRSGDRWWWEWGPRTVHLSVRHRRRRSGSPTGAPASRPGTPGQVITNYKGSTANEPEPCWYCHCMSSAFKFSKSSRGNGATTAQRPKVNPPQHIIRVWCCNIHPGAAATQV